MRSARLVSMVMVLRTRDRWTAQELADELEVSVRTVYRDVAALQDAGVPLWTAPGRHGGIHLVPGWRTDLDALTGEEAGTLALSGVPGAAAELGLGAVAASAQRKVTAALPPELRARSARIAERFHLDAPGWFARPDRVDTLPVVADAVWSGRRLDLTYRRGERTVQRRVDPLGVVLKAGTWYLVAGHRGAVRSYRVGRIVTAALRDEPASRPEHFELADWWATASEQFDQSLLRYPCRLRCSPVGFRRLSEAVGVTAARAAGATAGPPDQHGWVELELRGESLEVLADQLLGLGPHVEVLSPVELRVELRALLDATRSLYDDR